MYTRYNTLFCSGQIVKSEQGERFPLPSPPLSFFLPFLPSLSPSLPLPSLALEVGPLDPARGPGEPKSNLVHFSLKM